MPAAMRDTSRRPTAQLTEKMLEGTESMLRGSTRWQRFKWELGIAGVTMPSEQIVALTVIGSLVAALMINVVFGSLLVALAVALAIPLTVRSVVKRKLAKQRKLFAEQLADNLQVLASALRAGHSFVGALAVVANDAADPLDRSSSGSSATNSWAFPSTKPCTSSSNGCKAESSSKLRSWQRFNGGRR